MKQKILDLIIAAKRTAPETGGFAEWLAEYLVANGVTVQRWIPVEERLPQKIDEYNVMIEGAKSPTTLWYLYGYGRWCEIVDDEMGETYAVTHWMPLPDPPGKDVTADA